VDLARIKAGKRDLTLIKPSFTQNIKSSLSQTLVLIAYAASKGGKTVRGKFMDILDTQVAVARVM